MKLIIQKFGIFLFLSVLITSCSKINPSASSKDGGSWFVDFNGKIDGGECFDIVKSKIDNKIYFCGAFLHVNNNWDMKNLARWIPSKNEWEQVPGIDEYHTNFIRCSAADNDGNLYFGGDFSTIGGVSAGRIAKFDVKEDKWYSLRDIDFENQEEQFGPVSGGVYAVAVSEEYVYIGGGHFNSTRDELKYIRRFNIGSKKWEALGTGTNGRVKCLTFDDKGNLYAGGEFTEAGGISAKYIAKWDGSSWSALGNGTDDYVQTIVVAKDTLYAGGSFKNAGENIHSQGIASWDGTEWKAMSLGVYASWGNSFSVQDIAIGASGKVYIGGFFDKNYLSGDSLNHVGVYENNEWKQLGTGLATSSSQGVICMYPDGKEIYFGGYFTQGTGNPNSKINTAIWREE